MTSNYPIELVTRTEEPTEPRIPVAQYYAQSDRRETIRLPAAAICRLIEEMDDAE